MRANDSVATAQVFLRSLSGKPVHEELPIETAAIEAYQPTREDTSAARTRFRAGGFEVGLLVGISFSITAPVSTFERFFSAELRVAPDGSVEVLERGTPMGPDLPLGSLPEELTGRVVGVTFSAPASFYLPQHFPSLHR